MFVKENPDRKKKKKIQIIFLKGHTKYIIQNKKLYLKTTGSRFFLASFDNILSMRWFFKENLWTTGYEYELMGKWLNHYA